MRRNENLTRKVPETAQAQPSTKNANGNVHGRNGSKKWSMVHSHSNESNTAEHSGTADLRPTSQSSHERPKELEYSEDGTWIVDTAGDVILRIQHGHSAAPFNASFKVNKTTLVNSSTYFHRLLDDERFAEGARVVTCHKALIDKYGTVAQAPQKELPSVQCDDVGQISAIRNIQPLMRDLLLILHGQELFTAKMPMRNAANLAIVADRFGCAETIGQYVTRRALVTSSPSSGLAAQSEESLRQRLLVGILFRESRLFDAVSHALIISGSCMWPTEQGRGPEDDSALDRAMWWYLPHGIEEELQQRRCLIVATVAAVQRHYVTQYTSRERQCKLGYDTSPQCDSFQCGEFLRFLVRNNLLQLGETYMRDFDGDEPDPVSGSLHTLLNTLKSYPSYQVNAHHTYCGPRKQLVQCINMLQDTVTSPYGTGICLDCWLDRTKPGRCLPWEELGGGVSALSGLSNRPHNLLSYQTRMSFTSKGETWAGRSKSLWSISSSGGAYRSNGSVDSTNSSASNAESQHASSVRERWSMWSGNDVP